MASVWLTFSQNDDDYLSQVISELALQNEAPPFKPHLTVYGSLNLKVDTINNRLRSLFEDQVCFEINCQQVQHSSNLWKTVYLKMEMNQDLKQIYHNLTEIFGSESHYKFDPHISLIYAQLERPDREKICRKAASEMKMNYQVCGLSIVDTGISIENWKTQHNCIFSN